MGRCRWCTWMRSRKLYTCLELCTECSCFVPGTGAVNAKDRVCWWNTGWWIHAIQSLYAIWFTTMGNDTGCRWTARLYYPVIQRMGYQWEWLFDKGMLEWGQKDSGLYFEGMGLWWGWSTGAATACYLWYRVVWNLQYGNQYLHCCINSGSWNGRIYGVWWPGGPVS